MWVVGRGVAGRATKKAQKRDPAKISGPCASPSLTSWIAHPPGVSRGGDDANRATKKVQKRDPSPSSRRWEARRCGGAMGRTVARQAQDDGAITGVVSFLIEGRPAPLGAAKKAQKRDPAKISGPCASPSPTSWIAHPRGLSRGGNNASGAQHDDVTTRLRSAFSTIEGRARRCGVLRMTGAGDAAC